MQSKNEYISSIQSVLRKLDVSIQSEYIKPETERWEYTWLAEVLQGQRERQRERRQ